jgi:formylglycine-generating enzyme required for sulfatase activity
MHSLEDIHQRLQALERRLDMGGLGVAPTNMALIPAGSFLMGCATGLVSEALESELPQHAVTLSAFYIDVHEVSKDLWAGVYDWATEHGYSFSSGCGLAKSGSHPVYQVSWFDCVKWCNARSEMAGLAACYTLTGEVYRVGECVPDCDFRAHGYRLPTEAEWEKAARGGLANRRFPWGDTATIQHGRANYFSEDQWPYDTSPTRNCHPTYSVEPPPYTSPVASFRPNDYGLYDMAGNVWEWCWDWYDATYYRNSPAADPTGPASQGSLTYRVWRGGSWYYAALHCRVSDRVSWAPDYRSSLVGFRTVMALGR